jgi:hypothetical protein
VALFQGLFTFIYTSTVLPAALPSLVRLVSHKAGDLPLLELLVNFMLEIKEGPFELIWRKQYIYVAG